MTIVEALNMARNLGADVPNMGIWENTLELMGEISDIYSDTDYHIDETRILIEVASIEDKVKSSLDFIK